MSDIKTIPTKKKKEAVPSVSASTNVAINTNKASDITKPVSAKGESGQLFSSISFWILLVTLSVLPFFLIPSQFVTIEYSKTWFFNTGISLSFLCFLISTIQKGSISVPKSIVTAGLGLLSLLYIFTALLNPAWRMSFFGYGFEMHTALAVFWTVISIYLVVTLSDTASRLKLFARGIIFGGSIVFIIQIFKYVLLGIDSLLPVRTYVSQFLPFFRFSDITNILGSASDLAVFSLGLSIFLAFIVEGKVTRGLYRLVLKILFVISLLTIALFGNISLHILMGAVYLLLFVGIYSFGRDTETSIFSSRSSKLSLVAILLCAVLLIVPNLSGRVLKYLSINANDTSAPSLSLTWGVAKSALSGPQMIAGTGPNLFSVAWNKFKPLSENLKPTWNISFASGGSYLVTSFVSTGLLGLVVWAIIVFGYFTLLYRLYSRRSQVSPYPRLMSFASLTAAGVTFLTLLFYVPQTIVVPMSIFFFLALAIALLKKEKILESKTYSFAHSPIGSFAVVLVIIVTLVFVGYCAYNTTAKTYAFYLDRVVQSIGYADTSDVAHDRLLAAARWGKTDLYYRDLASFYMMRIQKTNYDQTIDETSRNHSIRADFDSALVLATEAQLYNKFNFENYSVAGRLYRLSVPAKGAYESATNAYKTALSYNPHSPELYRLLAELEATNNNVSAARAYIAQSLGKKFNYASAYMISAQIEISKDNISEAIKILDHASLVVPQDAGVYFQLGKLYYAVSQYTKSAKAFEQVLNMIPVHADARFYLAMAYDKLGRDNEAVILLKSLLEANPNSEVILKEIERLEAPVPAPKSSKK